MSIAKESSIKIFIKKAIQSKLKSPGELEQFKKSFSKKGEDLCIKNAEIKKVYEKMILKKQIEPNESIEKILIARKVRTLSGVAVIAVLTKPYPCPGKCIYCPTEKSIPKSYLSNEPAVMRAVKWKFKPYQQVQARIKALRLNGHCTDKIELIVMGGTFSYLPPTYQKWFITECFRAANDFPKNIPPSKIKSSLEKEHLRNEHTKNRIIGLTLETRPDYISEKEVINFRKLGATRVELGVQTIFDEILKKNKRGHLSKETAQATKLLKNAGFKINYHLMPGLLGSSPEKDLEMFQVIFTDQRFQPDMVKIYPCVVTKGSELFKLWKNKKYLPLSNEKNKELIKQIKKVIPPYVRITRLIRDIPTESIIAGPNIPNLRQMIQREETYCQCIRCREIKEEFNEKDRILLNRIIYPASEGTEIFLQYTSPDKKKLYALLRLRIPGKREFKEHCLSVLEKCAIIREVHTYGKMTKISKRDLLSPQHIGLGKKLILEAEQIAKNEYGLKKIAVISGIGVRNYYRRIGYRKKETYMIKNI
jgi:elongator complex protein 3